MAANKAIWQERKETAAQQNDISLITKIYKVGQIKQLDLLIILNEVMLMMREDIYAYMCNIINISKNAQTVQTNLC